MLTLLPFLTFAKLVKRNSSTGASEGATTSYNRVHKAHVREASSRRSGTSADPALPLPPRTMAQVDRQATHILGAGKSVQRHERHELFFLCWVVLPGWEGYSESYCRLDFADSSFLPGRGKLRRCRPPTNTPPHPFMAELTNRRTLVVAVSTGALVFMLGEGAGFVTSFYWAVVTASSIGYGDVVPTTPPMQWFTAFYR